MEAYAVVETAWEAHLLHAVAKKLGIPVFKPKKASRKGIKIDFKTEADAQKVIELHNQHRAVLLERFKAQTLDYIKTI